MSNQEVLSIYADVADIFRQMAQAACNNDWALLVTLQERSNLLMQAIKAKDAQAALHEQERAQKIALIESILADDTVIRDMTIPHMAQLSQRMKRSSMQTRLKRVYAL